MIWKKGRGGHRPGSFGVTIPFSLQSEKYPVALCSERTGTTGRMDEGEQQTSGIATVDG